MSCRVLEVNRNQVPLKSYSLSEKLKLSLFLTRAQGEAHMFRWQVKWEKLGDALGEKKVTLSALVNSNMVNSEKFYCLHLIYHFAVVLNLCKYLK